MEYTVVAAESLKDLVKDVNVFIKSGWKPVGGVAYDGKYYLQAMFKL